MDISRPVAGSKSLSIRNIWGSENQLYLTIVLTLLLLLLYSHRYWYVNIPLSIIALAGLILPSISVSRKFWGVVTTIIALVSFENWYALDNHKYLLGYWCFALFCCFFAKQPEKSLAKTARLLIGLVFAIGVLQKTLSDNYLDGTFMHYELLLDGRFSGLARYLGGIPDHMQELNLAARRALVNYDSHLSAVQLMSTDGLSWVSVFITWWNYIIQIVIGFAFLSRKPAWLYGSRDVWLLLFLFTTYLFAPVIGFGWVLAIMGIAQTHRGQTTVRALYVIAFLFLQVYRLPWAEIRALASVAGADA